MSRKNIVQGTILEVPLLENLGYGYVQIVLPHEFAEVEESVSIYPKDIRSKTNSKKYSLEEISNTPILSHPYLMMDYPVTRGRNKWEIIGTSPIADDLKFVPDFKYCPKYAVKAIENESLVDSWHFVRNFYPNDSYQNSTEYNNVKHLRRWLLFNQKAIQIALTLEWMKKLGIEATHRFEREQVDPMEAYWFNILLYEIKKLPFYKDIPLEYRGRAIEK